jgi:hypothetical protein
LINDFARFSSTNIQKVRGLTDEIVLAVDDDVVHTNSQLYSDMLIKVLPDQKEFFLQELILVAIV